MKRALPALAALFCAAASGALAQEVITTGPEGSPPAAEAARPAPERPPVAAGGPGNSPEAIGRWARGVLAGEPAQKDEAAEDGAPRPRCTPVSPDGKAHGAVWAGVGTGGYRNVGGVVTQPLGACGSVTIAVDKTEFGGRRRR